MHRFATKYFVWALAASFLLIGACSFTEGQPTDFSELGYFECTSNADCDFGYCNPGGFCSSDCRKDGDCVAFGGDMACVNFQCLKVCESTADCDFGFCGDNGHCVSECQKDEDCVRYGSDLSCNNFRCLKGTPPNPDGDTPDGDTPDGDTPDGDTPDGDTPGETVVGECTTRDAAFCEERSWLSFCDDYPCFHYGYDAECNADNQCVTDETIDFGEKDESKNAAAYVGVWGGMYTTAALTVDLPLIGEQKTVTVHPALFKISQQGEKILIHTKNCKMVMYNFNDEIVEYPPESLTGGMVLPEAYWTHTAVLENTVDSVPELAAGNTFASDSWIDIRGALLENIADEALPRRDDYLADDPRIWDQDEDGDPGMTTNMVGLIGGKVYSTQRWSLTFKDSTIIDENHIKGILGHGNEQYQIHADPASIIYDTKSYPWEEEPERSYFRMVRMDDFATCEDVIPLVEPESGDWLRFTAFMDDVPDP